MPKTCKIKPLESTCRFCLETAMSFDAQPDCRDCLRQAIRYELIEIGHNFWGSFAIVQAGGKLSKVSLSRVYDIREESDKVNHLSESVKQTVLNNFMKGTEK